MAIRLKEYTVERRNILKSKTPYALPDNPSDKGLSADQIKAKFYEGTMQLYDWMADTVEQLNTDIYDSGLALGVSQVSTALSIISNGESRISALEEGKVPKSLSIITSEVVPKSLSILEQNSIMIYADNNGTPSKINLNNLDYSKMKVSSNESDMANIRTNDYLFLKKGA